MKMLNKFSVIITLASVATLSLSGVTRAVTITVDLGTAAPFAILAGEGITNVPNSAITGNVGLYPAAGGFYSELTQAEVTGTIYSRNAAGPAGYVEDPVLLLAAKNDLTAAYLDAAGRTPFTTLDSSELGGRTLTAGVYTTGSTALGITGGAGGPGPLVLDGQNDPTSVFIFEGSGESAGALTVGPGGTVSLINMASACNVFWRVYGATINTSAVFKGNILALTSITVAGGVGTGSNIEGRLLARNANVTLDHTTVAVPICTVATATSTPTPTPTPTPVLSATSTPSPTLSPTLSPALGSSVTPTPSPTVVPKFPKTGIAPDEKSIPWNAAIPVGILALVLGSVALNIRKRA